MTEKKKRGRPKKIIAETTPPVAQEAVVTLIIAGRRYSSSGSTVREALETLKPEIKKGRGILVSEHNGVKRERVLNPVQTFRLFSSHGVVRDIILKNFTMLLT